MHPRLLELCRSLNAYTPLANPSTCSMEWGTCCEVPVTLESTHRMKLNREEDRQFYRAAPRSLYKRLAPFC